MTTPELAGLLEALGEPALLVERSGRIRQPNRAALRLLGDEPPLRGRRLGEIAADPPEALAGMLQRCAGTNQPLIGALRLRTSTGAVEPFRWRGCRVAGAMADGEPILLLRLEHAAEDRFLLLREKMVALNAEIARNRRIQRQLESALEQKGILLRELHHRVKNNLQTLLGILLIGERNTTAPEARAVLVEARLRIEAMVLVQRLLYRQDDLSGVDGAIFLRELCAGIERSCGRPGIRLEVRSSPTFLGLDLASAVGLIVNELVTNAYKHAFAGREQGKIEVELDGGDGEISLIVADDGRGFAPCNGSGTGLMLVRGLAGQQNGACRFETSDGARCVVTLGRGCRHGASVPG